MYRISFHIKAALIVINFKINIENYVNVMMLLSSNSVQLHQHSNVLPCKQIFLLLFTFISSSVESLWMFWTQKKNFFFHLFMSSSLRRLRRNDKKMWNSRLVSYDIMSYPDILYSPWKCCASCLVSLCLVVNISSVYFHNLLNVSRSYCIELLLLSSHRIEKKRKLFCVRIINDDIDFIIVGISGWNMMKTSCFQV